MHTVGFPRTCIGFTNFCTFIVAVVVFVVCLWCAINTEFFNEVNYTVTKSSLVESTSSFVNMKLWFTPVTTILIPIAAIAIMTSCCGILGAGCKVKCAMKSYVFFVTCLSAISFWIFFISGIYNIYTQNEKTKKSLQWTLETNYGKENDMITYVWNHVMVNYQCCGVESHRDFVNSPWRKLHPDQVHPVHCCKLSNVTGLIPVSQDCTRKLEDTESYREYGCFHVLRQSINRNKGKIIFYVILISFMYLCLISFSYCIVRGAPLLDVWNASLGDMLRTTRTYEEPEQLPERGYAYSHASYDDEKPKKIVKVVSSVDPFRSYAFAPRMYNE